MANIRVLNDQPAARCQQAPHLSQGFLMVSHMVKSINHDDAVKAAVWEWKRLGAGIDHLQPFQTRLAEHVQGRIHDRDMRCDR